MSKSVCLGNNHCLILLDQFGQVDDFFYPYVGLENQTGEGYVHKLGVWVDGQFSWLDDGSWQIDVDYLNLSMVSQIIAKNEALQVILEFNDCLDTTQNIFVRKVKVTNTKDKAARIKVFFNQQFEIYESSKGDTAIYNHDQNVIIHYKGSRVFVINSVCEKTFFQDYSVGLLGLAGREGTFKDAEDGVLEKNSVEHGTVDSVIANALEILPGQDKTIYYWLTAGKTIDEALDLNNYVLANTAQTILTSTTNYWQAWVNKEEIDLRKIQQPLADLFTKSLLIINSHLDKSGSIVASGDYDLLKQGWGTYSYMWTRDGALVLKSLNEAGYEVQVKRFLQMCSQLISKDGYLLHKYRADGTLGDSWHPWVRENRSELPIQEDETALVLHLLYQYYQKTKDLEFIEEIYTSFIQKAGDFMLEYLEKETGLPKPTYDLWEENFGVHCFTSCTVYAGLQAVAKLVFILGRNKEDNRYSQAAEVLKQAIVKNFWNPQTQYFNKTLYVQNGKTQKVDENIDISSVFGIFEYGILPVTDEKVIAAIATVEQKLIVEPTKVGVARYAGDKYFRVNDSLVGNPWIITSLWLARYYLYAAKESKDLAKVFTFLNWVRQNSRQSGILSEQVNPFTGEQISASPLIWSQGEYVFTMLKLIEKQRFFELQKADFSKCDL
jgi:GH15 family glucan-1,4-alpha-glucosidase